MAPEDHPKDPDRSPYTIDAVDNAAQILLMLNDRPWLRTIDVARELDVARSTAHRMVSTLLQRGLLRYNPDDKSYGAGFKLVELGMSVLGIGDLKSEAAPFLARAAAETGETSQLIVLEGDEIVFLSAVEGGRVIRAGSRVGARVAAHATAAGKCLLAWMAADELDQLYPSSRLPEVTGATIRSRRALIDELRLVREVGYAMNDGESEEGLAAISAPVLDSRGAAHGAISISGPRDRVVANRDLYRHAVQQTASDLGRKLFGERPA